MACGRSQLRNRVSRLAIASEVVDVASTAGMCVAGTGARDLAEALVDPNQFFGLPAGLRWQIGGQRG